MNDDTPNDLSELKNQLETRKLRLEIERLLFETKKLSRTNPIDAAAFEKSKQDLEFGSLTRGEVKQDLEIQKLRKELAKLGDDRKKSKLERRQLAIDLKTLQSCWGSWFNLSRILPGASGMMAMVISILSLYWVNNKIAESQIKKAAADQILHQDKFFRETLAKATEQGAPLSTHIAFLSALNAFWNARQATTLANAFTSLLLYDKAKDAVTICGASLLHAYEIPSGEGSSVKADQEAIRKELFGSVGTGEQAVGQIGVIQRAIERLSEPSYKNEISQDLANLRLQQLSDVISYNRSRLRSANFNGLMAEGLELVRANLTDSDLGNLQATRWFLTDADFSRSRLVSAKLDSCALDGALFRKAVLDYANLVGSTLVKADFTDASYSHYLGLGGTNLLGTTGLTSAALQRAFDDGAVRMTPEKFRFWKKKGSFFPSDKGKRQSWQENDFSIDDKSGTPVLKGGETLKSEELQQVNYSG
jgi:uncharacterized protein YjbI with pentapeptide repeats